MDKWDSEGQNGLSDPDMYKPSTSDSSDDGSRDGGKKCKKCSNGIIFLIFLLCGIICGIAIGLGVRFNHPDFTENDRHVMYLEFPGKLMMRMLKMCIVPLVFSSLVAGMASIPSQAAGRLGGTAVAYYMITTFMAVLLGMLLVATIKPGLRHSEADKDVEDDDVEPIDSLLDLIRNLFPDNIIAAASTRVRTVVDFEDTMEEIEIRNVSMNVSYMKNMTVEMEKIKVVSVGGTNVLGIVLFSILLGVVIGRMGNKGIILCTVFDTFQMAIIKIYGIILWFVPIGICFLLAGKLIRMKDLKEEFSELGWYIMTVLVGLAIHGFVILPIIYFLFTRMNPFKLLGHMMRALLTALGTASSSATMPVTLKCLEENAKVDRRVSRFVIPVGATINMDGTALYEAVASIYLAQTLGYSMNAGKYVTVSLTATAAAIGAAGVPEAGLVTMLIVLTAIGLPASDETIGLILAVDWFLDRCRTMINVWGDSIGAGIVEKLSRKQLEKLDEEGKGHDNLGYQYGLDPTAIHTRL